MLSHFSRVRLFVTPWTVAHQAPLSTEFCRQEYWSGLPALLQGIFLTQGSNQGLPHWQAGSWPLAPPGKHTLGQRCSLGAQNWRSRWRRSPRPPWPCPWCCGRRGEKWPRRCRTPPCRRSGIWLHWRCQAGSWLGKPRRRSPELWSPGIQGHSRRQWLSPCCTQWGAPCAQNECPSQRKGERFPADSTDNHLDQGAHGNDTVSSCCYQQLSHDCSWFPGLESQDHSQGFGQHSGNSHNEWSEVKAAQSCLTLHGTNDYTVHGFLQARILEWVAFPFSRGSSQARDRTQVSHIAGGFFASWATREAQEYWSGLPFPSPVDLPNPGIELGSPALPVNSLPTELSGKFQMWSVGGCRCLFWDDWWRVRNRGSTGGGR